jgi:hypothetical protein
VKTRNFRSLTDPKAQRRGHSLANPRRSWRRQGIRWIRHHVHPIQSLEGPHKLDDHAYRRGKPESAASPGVGPISKTQLIDKSTILMRVTFIEIFALRVDCVTKSSLRVGKFCKELRVIMAITNYLPGIVPLIFVVFQIRRFAV